MEGRRRAGCGCPLDGDNLTAVLLICGGLIAHLLAGFVAVLNMIALWRCKRVRRQVAVAAWRGWSGIPLPAISWPGRALPVGRSQSPAYRRSTRRLLRPSLLGGRCAADVLTA